ncbi:branched-chain amino acid ABC transporter substrate-binding protein [Deinococcus oregonensis]|uniref:Branched-chain amino acid ABC transporter substrate-binding protein n=1 Tax=Deinococcus oregonensis TaxID=1805970 RepID=A0ABV6AYY3_9DEIO
MSPWNRCAALLTLTLLSVAAAVPLKIASVSPLSGGLTGSGTELKRGVELSVSQHLQEFKTLGYELSLVSFDDQGSPVAAKPLAQQLAADKSILGVVGAYNSSVSNVLAGAFAPTKLAIVSVSTNDQLTKNSWSHFNRVVAPDGAQSVAAGRYLINAQPKAVFIISDNTTYGNGLTRSVLSQLKTSAVKVAGYGGVSTDPEISRMIQTVKASGATMVYFGGTDDVGGRLVKAFNAAKVKVSLVGSDGIDSPNFIRQVTGLAENITYTTVFGPVSLFTNSNSFAEKYKATYKAPASGLAAYAYDAAEALLSGLKAAVLAAGGTPTRAQVSTAVRRINLPSCFTAERSGCQTITGALAFSATGERQKSAVLVMKYDEMLQTKLTKFQAIDAKDLK